MLAVLFSAGAASAATPGVGTSSATTNLLQLDLADVLTAKVLGDNAKSSIDKAIGTPEASALLQPLSLTSGTVAALNKQIAPTEVRTQGAQKSADYSADLGALGLPQIVDGSLTPASLLAVVDSTGARGGMVDNLADLVIGGGLVSVDSVAANLGSAAASDASTGARTLSVGTITGLDLGALLDGLGLPVDQLGLGTIEGLVDQLGLLGAGNPVEDLLTTLGIPGAVPTDAAGLGTLVTGLQGALTTATTNLTSLQATIAGPLGGVCGAVPLLDAVALPLGLPSGTTCAAGLATLTGNQTAAAGDVSGLLGGLLQMVDGTNLLTIDGIDAGVVSKATDTIGTSVASVAATIGDITVANLATIPGLDAAATAAQVTGAVGTVTDQLDGILGTVSPDLAGLIDLKLLDTTGTGITKSANGYVHSIANLTGLDLSINPPANLAAIVSGLPATGIGDVLAGLPGFTALPALPGTASMDALGTVLSVTQPIDALVNGARLRIASVNGVSDFLPSTSAAAAPTTPSNLPRTGGSTAGFAVAGVLMAMLGLGLRRRVLAPVRAD